jgi:4-hydroxy-3-methylbut-2-en-1-yl diphosphate reductase
MKIIRATHLGMCFGVRDAISLAKDISSKEDLTILGDLVHNPIVLQELQTQGIQIHDNLANVHTSHVMITAHGASDFKIQQVREQGHQVVEATCPLVHFAHQQLKKLVAENYHPIVIGKRDHVEVRGLTEDLPRFDIVLTLEDILQLTERPRFGVISQTTQPIDRVHHLVELIQLRFPNSELRFVDTVCQPTKQRQSSAIELAKSCDVVVVIGGAHSNNTRELTATCSKYCDRVLQVQSAQELRPFWFYNAETVGITAGTSTSDQTINEVEQWLKAYDQNKDAFSIPINPNS